MDVENPIKCSKDMLFDYPKIKTISDGMMKCFGGPLDDKDDFDVLVINSAPGSGQFSGYDEFKLGEVSKALVAKGFEIITTAKVEGLKADCAADFGADVSRIGSFSLHCHTILMVSTGPSWPTFNVWNQESVKHRIILLEPERVNLSPNTMHCATIDEAAEVLKGAGLL